MIVKSLDHLRLISNKIADHVSEKDCILLIGEIGVGKQLLQEILLIIYKNKRHKRNRSFKPNI